MQKQIRINGQWVDGDPTVEGQKFRLKISVGNGFGFQEQTHTLVTASDRRTNVTMGELITLMGFAPYTSIHQAAYGDGSVPTQDDRALYFLERNRYLVGQSIDVSDNSMGAELDSFITFGYMTEADKVRITQGIEL